MSSRMLVRLALALVVLLLVWGGLRVFSRGARDQAGQLAIPALTPAEVQRIIMVAGPDTTVLMRRDSAWTVNGLPASGEAVTAFLAAASDSTFRSQLVSESPATHVRMGVDSVSARHVMIAAGPRSTELWFGHRGPDFEGFFVRKGDDARTYLLTGTFAELSSRGVEDWRDREIARVAAAQVGAVLVRRGGAGWELRRGVTGWSVGGAAADSTKVDRLLRHFEGLRATGFPTSTELDSIRFSPADRGVTLLGTTGDTLLALEMDSTPSGSFWVRRHGGMAIYRLDGRSADLAAPDKSALLP